MRRTELALNGLVLKYAFGDTDQISFDRQFGLSSKTVFCPLMAFHAEAAKVTDVCLARAEASKHGALLKDILANCLIPGTLSATMDPDAADQVFHRLREMMLLILVEEVASRGSALARKLRGKKTRLDAAKEIDAVLASLAREFICEEGSRRDDGPMISSGP